MRSVIRLGSFGLVFATLMLSAGSTSTQELQEQVRVEFQHAIPNVEGKSMVAVIVRYPPGGKSPAHHHAPSAFVYAYVLSGSIRSKVGDEPAKIYKVGESFYEVPGSYHAISENASAKEPASLLAVFVVDSKDTALTIPDKK